MYKTAALSKKKLHEKNKKLQVKLNQKDCGKKAELARQLKTSQENAKYWEDQHAKVQEELTGKHTMYVYTHVMYDRMHVYMYVMYDRMCACMYVYIW